MGNQERGAFGPDAAAFEWAKTFVSFEAVELVSDAPWARTHRLLHSDRADYLKILPPSQSNMVNSIAALTQRFPSRVPKLIAFDADRGWLLSAAQGGRTLEYGSENIDMIAYAS